MVAIITAAGWGLERSSGSLLGSRGTLGNAAVGRASDGVTVNAATGNLVIQNIDEVLIGRGPDAVVNRTYNSLGNYLNDKGNWLFNGQRKIVITTGTANSQGSVATLTGWDGSVVTFAFADAATGYRSADNPYRDDTLTFATNIWTWTEGKSRRVEKFTSLNSGRIISSEDADGNAVTYDYNTSNNLTKITTANSAVGKSNFTTLTYSGNNLTSLVTTYLDLTLSAPVEKTLTRTRYDYDASNRLANVTIDLSPNDGSIADLRTYVTTYKYTDNTTSKLVASIEQSDGSKLNFTYSSGKIQSVVETVETGVTFAILAMMKHARKHLTYRYILVDALGLEPRTR
jgi:YD repeat-containing protein